MLKERRNPRTDREEEGNHQTQIGEQEVQATDDSRPGSLSEG